MIEPVDAGDQMALCIPRMNYNFRRIMHIDDLDAKSKIDIRAIVGRKG